jgi:hypothetical protein
MMLLEPRGPLPAQPLVVRQRADCIMSLRWLSTGTMRLLARWTPETPEMEVKLLFGKHIHDFAQFADALGKRVHELRMPLQAQRDPAHDFLRSWNQLVSDADSTPAKLKLVYGGVIPFIDAFVVWYRSNVDPLLDEPTFRVFEHFVVDARRMHDEAAEVLDFVASHADLLGYTDDQRAALGLALERITIGSVDDFVDYRSPLSKGERTK